jgi:hypothetical protein
MGGFLDNYPLKVLASEKKIITGMTVEHRGESLARNAAGLIRILETALTLNEAAGKPSKEVHELKEEKALLETKVLGHENRVEDLIGKQENFARVKAELREQETELEQLRKEVGDLRIKAGEMDKLEEEVSRLKAAMAPAVDEPDTTCDLSSRAELAGEIRLLGGKLIDRAKFAFNNAVEQMQVVNEGVELSTTRIGFWWKAGRSSSPTSIRSWKKWSAKTRRMNKTMMMSRRWATGKVVISFCPNIMACTPLYVMF